MLSAAAGGGQSPHTAQAALPGLCSATPPCCLEPAWNSLQGKGCANCLSTVLSRQHARHWSPYRGKFPRDTLPWPGSQLGLECSALMEAQAEGLHPSVQEPALLWVSCSQSVPGGHLKNQHHKSFGVWGGVNLPLCLQGIIATKAVAAFLTCHCWRKRL